MSNYQYIEISDNVNNRRWAKVRLLVLEVRIISYLQEYCLCWGGENSFSAQSSMPRDKVAITMQCRDKSGKFITQQISPSWVVFLACPFGSLFSSRRKWGDNL